MEQKNQFIEKRNTHHQLYDAEKSRSNSRTFQKNFDSMKRKKGGLGNTGSGINLKSHGNELEESKYEHQ